MAPEGNEVKVVKAKPAQAPALAPAAAQAAAPAKAAEPKSKPASPPKKKPGVPKFVIAMGPNNQHRWQFMDGTGTVIVSSIGIPIKEACYESIRFLKDNALSRSRYERVDKEGVFKFRLRAPNHSIVAESVPFKTKEERDQAMQVTRLAPQSAVIDKS